jgi:hypothetical protein
MNPFALQTEAVSSITPAEDEEDYQDEIDITAKFIEVADTSMLIAKSLQASRRSGNRMWLAQLGSNGFNSDIGFRGFDVLVSHINENEPLVPWLQSDYYRSTSYDTERVAPYPHVDGFVPTTELAAIARKC